VELPQFKRSRVLQLLLGISRAWGPGEAAALEKSLRAVTDPADYLRRVAALGPEASRNLVTAAVLGLSVAAEAQRLTDARAVDPKGN
jgi:hypothetical protein